MNQHTLATPDERRDHIRRLARDDVALICGDEELLARLIDISLSGLQFEIDAAELDRIKDELTEVRLKDLPPLPIELIWGIGDSFGARFTGPQELVEAVVDSFLTQAA